MRAPTTRTYAHPLVLRMRFDLDAYPSFTYDTCRRSRNDALVYDAAVPESDIEELLE